MDLFSTITVREAPPFPRLLKWKDKTMGKVLDDGSVEFNPAVMNTVMNLTTNGKTRWTASEFKQFLEERLPSKARRDIDKILHRAGLSEYKIMRLAGVTRAMNARDLFWLAFNEDERFSDIVEGTIKMCFFVKEI